MTPPLFRRIRMALWALRGDALMSNCVIRHLPPTPDGLQRIEIGPNGYKMIEVFDNKFFSIYPVFRTRIGEVVDITNAASSMIREKTLDD
jgi:hypothetical protein